MLDIFYKGVFSGLLLAMLIGPVFFALIRTSIEKGFKSGAYLALGVAMSDSFVLFLVYFGISQFANHPTFQMGLGLIGGVLMIVFGITPFVKSRLRKKFNSNETQHILETPPGSKFLLEGALLNLINPFVYMFWLAIVGGLPKLIHVGYTDNEAFVFFLGTILTVLITDLIKAFFANLITNFINAQTIAKIDKVAGIGIGAFGVRLLYFAMYGK